MIYCDTSLLVAIITTEDHSADARSWFFAAPRSACVISDWTGTEIACAIARKYRGGFIADDDRRVADRAWSIMTEEMRLVAVERHHFARAAELADAAPRGLRAGDALHLAIALDHGCDLATLDRDLADAARVLGVAVHP